MMTEEEKSVPHTEVGINTALKLTLIAILPKRPVDWFAWPKGTV